MNKNFDKKTGMYRFVKVAGVDWQKFTDKDVSIPVFFDKQTVDEFKHIKENLYEYNGDYFAPSNYGFFKNFFNR